VSGQIGLLAAQPSQGSARQMQHTEAVGEAAGFRAWQVRKAGSEWRIGAAALKGIVSTSPSPGLRSGGSDPGEFGPVQGV